MDQLQTLKVFIAVAETRSFTAGARKIGLSAPSATRGINALEARLSARLFVRTTRSVRLTDVGEAYLEDARRILAELQAADDAASGTAANPAGHLKITCPNEFGRIHIMPILAAFLNIHSEMTAEVLMVDRIVNIAEEGFDVAVRIGPLPSSGLSAVRVGSVRRVVCGAPGYFEQNPAPTETADLKQHRIVSISPVTPHREWRFGRKSDQVVSVKPQLVVSSVAAGIDVAIAGWGLCRVLSYQIGSSLESGKLRTVLTDYEPEALPIHLVHIEGRRAVAKVRSFIDFAAERLRAGSSLK